MRPQTEEHRGKRARALTARGATSKARKGSGWRSSGGLSTTGQHSYPEVEEGARIPTVAERDPW